MKHAFNFPSHENLFLPLDCPLGHHLQVVESVPGGVVIGRLGVSAHAVTNLTEDVIMLIIIAVNLARTHRHGQRAQLHQALHLVVVILLLHLHVGHLELLLLAEVSQHANIVAVLSKS